MTLEFIDSFDHYSATEFLNKWNAASATPVIETTVKRTGRASLRIAANQYVQKTISTGTTKIIGFALRTTSLAATSAIVGTYYNGTIQATLYIRNDGALSVRRSATELTASAPGLISTDVWNYIEWKITISDTVGAYEVKLNGLSVIDDTGQDTQNIVGNSTINQIRFLTQNTAGAFTYWDDLYIGNTDGTFNNDFLGDIKIECLMPDTDASYQEWSVIPSGTHFSTIDEIPPNGVSDYVYSSGVGAVDTYNFQSLATTSGTVFGIQVVPFMRKDDAGSRTISPVFNIDTVLYSGSVISVTDSYTYHPSIIEKNPDTDGAWTINDISILEAGIMIVS